jgi:hypothetical protein
MVQFIRTLAEKTGNFTANSFVYNIGSGVIIIPDPIEVQVRYA